MKKTVCIVMFVVVTPCFTMALEMGEPANNVSFKQEAEVRQFEVNHLMARKELATNSLPETPKYNKAVAIPTAVERMREGVLTVYEYDARGELRGRATGFLSMDKGVQLLISMC